MREHDGLDVGIVTYRSARLLEQCLRSLETHRPARPLSVVVVDNGPPDGTGETVRRFPGVELIEPRRNLGFAAATNVALARTQARYFLALNPDTRVHAGTLETLLELMDADASIAICGCRLELPNGTLDHAAKRSFPTPLGALAHFTRIARSQYRAPGVERGRVDAVNGAFMLMRRSALAELGPFDEGYWMYMEDLDLCYRAAEAGWATWYEPSVAATHVKGGTSGRYRSLRLNYAFHYGMARFYRLHYARRHGPAFNAAIYAGIGAKLGISVTRSAAHRYVLGSR